MRIAEVHLYRYHLPLTSPLAVGDAQTSTRQGLLMAVESDTGAVGWGDVAPLPGFSAETLEEAVAHLDALRSTLVGQSVPEEMATGDRPWTEAPASVRFGIELAIAGIMAKARSITLPEVLTEDPRSTVSLNALLSGSPDAVMQEAEQIVADGYRAAKLKVGRRDLQTEIELVRALIDRFGGTLTLRLDANRAWTLDEAQAFFEAVDPASIDYIEEPLADPDALPKLAEEGVPVALDETMRDLSPNELDLHRYAEAVVLKPTLVSGFMHSLGVARHAIELGMTPVVSAAYESGIGLRGLVALAASMGEEDVPVGLDTYRRLRADVLKPRLPLDRPVLDIPALMRTPIRLNPDTVDSADQPIANP